jgi:hypothetical protein
MTQTGATADQLTADIPAGPPLARRGLVSYTMLQRASDCIRIKKETHLASVT